MSEPANPSFETEQKGVAQPVLVQQAQPVVMQQPQPVQPPDRCGTVGHGAGRLAHPPLRRPRGPGGRIRCRR